MKSDIEELIPQLTKGNVGSVTAMVMQIGVIPTVVNAM